MWSDPLRTPIAGINVQAHELVCPPNCFWATTATPVFTDSNGLYTLTGLPARTYRVVFSDPAGIYAQNSWTSSATVESGSDIPMEAGATVSDIDVVMAPGVAISGTVRYQGDASPIEGIQVIAWIWDAERWVWASDRHTDASGAYMMNGLPAGQYRVQFASSDQTYAAHYYDGASTRNSANDVILSIGQSEPGIDATLALASGISGTVTGPDGVTPLENMFVQVYQWDTINSLWEPIRRAISGSDGAYMIGGLAAGTYRLGFISPFGDYAPRFFQDATDLSSGADVFVAAETTVTGIDVSLAPAARISCIITGPGGILLEFGSVRAIAYRWDDSGQGWQPATQSARWTLDGRYAIRGLAAGTYRVMFVDDDGEYLAQVYDGASDLDSGTDIEMVEGAQITIEVELALASSMPPHFITGIRGASQDEIEISYRGALGMEYGLQALLTHTGSWHQVGSSGLAVGSTNTFRHTAPAPAAWWRVIRLR